LRKFCRAKRLADVERCTFGGGDGIGEVLAGLGYDLGHGGVVVVGVVVEEDELLHVGAASEFGRLQPCAVAPADVVGVGLGRVLRVVDEDVCVAGCVEQGCVGCGVAVFVVGCVDGDGTVAADAVAGCASGVVEGEGRDGEIAEADAFGSDLYEGSGGVQEVELDGEVGADHLAVEDVAEMVRAMRGVKREGVARGEQGREAEQALDVIPMEVGEEDVYGARDAGLCGEFAAELVDAGAAVEEDGVAVGNFDLDAGGVAAVAEVRCHGCWVGAAGSPDA